VSESSSRVAGVGDLVANSKTAIAVASAGMVLIVYEAYDGFYSRLHVPPDAQPGTTDLLEKAGLGLVLVAAFVSVIVLLAVLAVPPPAQPMKGRRKKRGHQPVSGAADAITASSSVPQERRLVRLILGILLVVTCLAPSAVTLAAPGDFGDVATTVALIVLIFLPFGVVGFVVVDAQLRPLIAFIVAAVFIACGAVLAHQWGQYQADRVLDGRSRNPSSALGVVRFTAQPICLRWIAANIGGHDTDKTPDRAVLLGRTAQLVVVLEGSGDKAHVLQIPANDVLVSTRVSASC
jgi:hypothetical protein